MIVGYNAPSKGQVLNFTLSSTATGGNALDLTQYVHCIRVYEDICKKYITAQVIIYDNNNVIEGLQITAGCPANLRFWSPPNNKPYDTSGMGMTVLKLKGEQMPNTLNWQMYYIDLIGSAYYQDRATQATDFSMKGETGTAAIRRIWSQYISTGGAVSTFNESLETQGSFNTPQPIDASTPFTAIDWIMRKMDDTTQTGNWLMFRDRNQMRLGQALTLFQQAITPANDANRSFIQKETWSAAQNGMPWGGGFNDLDNYRAIVIAQMNTNTEELAGGGRSSGVDIGATVAQKVMSFDTAMGQFTPNFGSFATGISGALAGGGGTLGSAFGGLSAIAGNASRIAAARVLDSSKQGLGIMKSNAPAGAYQFAADVAGSPSLVVKVPMQTGLNCTVGQGINCLLVPPTGPQLSNYYKYLLSGSWLVTQLCHEIYTDERESQATTVMKTLKGTIPTGS